MKFANHVRHGRKIALDRRNDVVIDKYNIFSDVQSNCLFINNVNHLIFKYKTEQTFNCHCYLFVLQSFE